MPQPATASPSANGHAVFPQAPDLVRLNYFYGQLLGVQDFRTEQEYFRAKLKLLNRCLHGHGVVCGLEVKPGATSAPAPAPPQAGWRETHILETLRRQAAQLPPEMAQQLEQLIGGLEGQAPAAAEPTTGADGKPCPIPLAIEPGLALDRDGNELLVRAPYLIPDIWKRLSKEDQDAVNQDVASHQPVSLHVSLCHSEVSFGPTRRVLPDACQGASGMECGRVRDDVCVKVTYAQPADDVGCETCCHTGGDVCEYLARIDNYVPGQALDPTQMHNEVRRPVGTYRFTRVKSVNWRHGHDYTLHDANKLLQHGLQIELTRPVEKRTLLPGIIEVLVFPLHAWRPREVRVLSGHVSGWPEGDWPTTTVKFTPPEAPREHCDRLSEACRIHILFRSAFVLDDCCRPVDGANVGGWVPWTELANHPHSPSDLCGGRGGGYGPWTSGAGSPGVNFESWFFVHCRQGESS